MSIQPGKKRSRESLRRTSKRRSGRRVLIVCEDEETEPAYFKGLCKQLRLGGAVVIAGRECQSAPIKVVDYALAEKRKAQQDRNPFDAVWAVFDRDQHGRLDRAIHKATQHGISLAFSVPCFEFWLLLHFRYTTQPFADCAALKRIVMTNKNMTPSEHAERLATQPDKRADAQRNAERVCQHHARVSDEAYPNPFTQVHRLVEFLETLM